MGNEKASCVDMAMLLRAVMFDGGGAKKKSENQPIASEVAGEQPERPSQ